MPQQLRPLNTVEILDAAWLLLRRSGALFYACSGIATAPLALLVMGYFLWLGTIVEGTANEAYYAGTTLWAVAMAIAWGFNSVARGAVTAAALAEARGEPISMGAAWKAAATRAPSMLFVGLATFAVALSAGVAGIAPGVLLVMGWWAARPALLDEERPFAAALRRSWRLTQGYRARAFGLWLLFLALAGMVLFNLHLMVEFFLGTVAGLLGVDTSGIHPQVTFTNYSYVLSLLCLTFVLLDPLKSATDAVFYLDLRIRREGADLQGRLAALRGALAVLILLLVLPLPAHAMPAEQYASRVRQLREQVARAKSPRELDPTAVGQLRNQLVQLPGNQNLDVRNDWLDSNLQGWRDGDAGGKAALERRLEALERSLGTPVAGGAGSETPKAASMPSVDAKGELKRILQAPEFQPLAERDELKNLLPQMKLKTKNWWSGFADWLKNMLFRPRPPQVQPPAMKAPKLEVPIWILLGLVVLFVLALIVRWIMERPVNDEPLRPARVGDAPKLEMSQTENALDHSVDEWELFAQQWLQRGDVRQAVRALYLATLVHLHRERRIDYNRAFTNWMYVRQFKGEQDARLTLRRLTQMFDEVWYGDRDLGAEQYQAFEQGVRTLGTPAPVTGPARG